MLDWIAVLFLLAVFFGLSSSLVVQALRKFYDNRLHGGLLVATLAVPYILVSLPRAAAEPERFLCGLGILLAYLFVPGMVLVWRPAKNMPLDVFDLLALLAIWLPVEFDWLPDASASLGSLSLPIPLLTAVCLGFLLFTVIRPLEKLGYTYRLRGQDGAAVLIALGGFFFVGLPLGITTGFIVPAPIQFDLLQWLLRFGLIYFLNALPEELLFRGAIQNLIEQRFGRSWKTLAVAAVIFGLSHINNTTAHHTPPNWPYVVMATFAGLAYGWTWQRSNKITASALTHTLVNFIWSIVFTA